MVPNKCCFKCSRSEIILWAVGARSALGRCSSAKRQELPTDVQNHTIPLQQSCRPACHRSAKSLCSINLRDSDAQTVTVPAPEVRMRFRIIVRFWLSAGSSCRLVVDRRPSADRAPTAHKMISDRLHLEQHLFGTID